MTWFHLFNENRFYFLFQAIYFGAVSSEDQITPPYIFEVDSKVNTKVYLDVLKIVVIPWCKSGGRVVDPGCGSRTSVPAHKLGFSRSAMTLYPSLIAPHLNSLDILWEHNQPLIATIRCVFVKLPPALVEKACSQFRVCIEAVIEADGICNEKIHNLLHNQVTWIDFFQKKVLK